MLQAIYYRIGCQKGKRKSVFLILADETSDCFNQEQLCLVISYVDSDYVIRKKFLGLLNWDLGFSGKTLNGIVLGWLIKTFLWIKL